MPDTKHDPRIDAYIRKAAPFARPILTRLREAVHRGCPGVEETLKWSHPSFMYKGMFAGMAAFKQHATFGFWKHELLVDALPAVEKKAWGNFGKLTSVGDLPVDGALTRMVQTAAKLNENGSVMPRPKGPKKPPVRTPADLSAALKRDAKAQKTYAAFPESKKRDYVEWLTEAKTDETRARRLATAVEWMGAGKARNWKYENC